MRVLLIGATGTIGSAVLPQLVERGHEVIAPVRSEDKASAVRAAGGTAVVADLADRAGLVALMRDSDAVITVAADGNDPAGFDRSIAEAAVEALGGSGKPYVHTGGVWVYGAGDSITETDPYDPPAVTAWRPAVIALLEAADLPLTVVHPGIVYGHGAGIATTISGGPRTEDGRLTTIGTGEQHWTTIHVDDLAALYVAIVEAGAGFGTVLGVSGDDPRIADLSAVAAGGAGVATEDADAARARIGALGEALLLDQRASGEKARSIGGWRPTRPTLTEEFASGEY